jgi:predicted nucleotidyltransferase
MEFVLPTDFKELLESLKETGVRYLLVGGYAVGLHGYPRTTNDFDIFVDSGAENAARIVAALSTFGFASDNLKEEIFTDKNSLVVIGVEPFAVDILNYLSAVDFESAYERRAIVSLQGLEISLIGLEDLFANKLAVGRHKDLNDVEELRKVNP